MKRLPSEDRAGIYITIIVHLVVLIVLMGFKLGTLVQKEHSFVLDFTKAEEVEKLQKELEFKQAVNDRLNELLSSGGSYVANVAVDRSALKDDRSSAEDTRKLYEDAQRLQEELQKGVTPKENEIVAAPEPVHKPAEKPAEKVQYSGPSVLSYELEGRKASHLPIPAYRCMGAGQVKVLIGVDPQGTVQAVKIDDAESSSDGCLRAFATRAARLSRFSASTTAPSRQAGYIVYTFVAQ
ncbi:MAG: hypothetical protein J5771_04155 [Bacteroidales bacterium]|nr:hypothetical protein [Bacteroidales bacterium]